MITEVTGSLSAVEGDIVELSVSAVGTAPLAYQWSKGGVALDGSTGSSLSLASVTPSDADDYKVAVSNGAGRVESESITVTVAQPASIVSQPEGGSAVLGETFVMSVVAAGTEPISYQWHKGGQAVIRYLHLRGLDMKINSRNIHELTTIQIQECKRNGKNEG